MKENNQWLDIDDLDDRKIKGVDVKFKLSDLKKFFADFDRQWLQINIAKKMACISNEGVDYEPIAFGEIIGTIKK